MNAPSQLSRAQEKALRDVAHGHAKFEREVKIGADGKFSETLPLRENDVLLLTLTRQ
jgi:xylan 1,4-beta-xylosidase